MAKQSVAKQSVKSTAKSFSPRSPSRTRLGGAKPKPSSKKGLRVQEQQYVGIDLHRRRSVIVRMNDAGEVLGVTKVANDPLQMSMAIAEAGQAAMWPWRPAMGGTGPLTCSGPRLPGALRPPPRPALGRWLHTASFFVDRVVLSFIWAETAIR